MNPIQRHTIRREIVLTLAYPLFWVVLLLLTITPKWLRRHEAVLAGHIYYRMGKRARRTARENLQRVYGSTKTPAELDQMTRDVFQNMARSFIDFFATIFIKNRKRYFRMVEVTGEEHLRRAYERGKGVICLIPHLSIWELSAVTPPMLGYHTSAASKAIKGRLIQQTMVWFRARRGMHNFSRDHSYNKLVQALNNGECMILMIDQDTKVRGVFVDFFGHRAYTPLGCARLAFETGCAVVPMATIRVGNCQYRFEIQPELPLIDTGNLEADLTANTQAETKAMEKFVARYPLQWVWMHRRWRTTPESLAAYLEQRRQHKLQQTHKHDSCP